MNNDDFRRFMFENPARFYLDTNPSFFAGTAVEAEVTKLATARSDSL